MTLARSLEETRRTLEAGGIEEAAVEADLFLMKALGINRAALYASPERELTAAERQTLARDLARRLNGEPWPYISGHREFYGLDFHVGPRVFIPRPETELLVDLVLKQAHALPSGDTIRIADACTGSGAIAVALAVHLPNAHVYATDIAVLSLDAARRNSEEHGVADRVTIIEGDLLGGVPGGMDIVVSNPPYVPRTELPYLSREVRTETLVSLDGGDEGLEIIRLLIPQAFGRLRRPGAFVMELSPEQGDAVREMCLAVAPDAVVTLHDDLAGLTRAVCAVVR